jgi:hypothetical protein
MARVIMKPGATPQELWYRHAASAESAIHSGNVCNSCNPFNTAIGLTPYFGVAMMREERLGCH